MPKQGVYHWCQYMIIILFPRRSYKDVTHILLQTARATEHFINNVSKSTVHNS